jgi:hypothetical protein
VERAVLFRCEKSRPVQIWKEQCCSNVKKHCFSMERQEQYYSSVKKRVLLFKSGKSSI